MDSTWNIDDDSILRLYRRGFWPLAVDAVLSILAFCLFGWWAALGAAVVMVLNRAKAASRASRYPQHTAARSILLSGLIQRSLEVGASGWWSLPAVLGSPVTALRGLVFGWGPPDISGLASVHARLVDRVLFVYDDDALDRNVELFQLGASPIPAQLLHQAPHDAGIVDVEALEAAWKAAAPGRDTGATCLSPRCSGC